MILINGTRESDSILVVKMFHQSDNFDADYTFDTNCLITSEEKSLNLKSIAVKTAKQTWSCCRNNHRIAIAKSHNAIGFKIILHLIHTTKKVEIALIHIRKLSHSDPYQVKTHIR